MTQWPPEYIFLCCCALGSIGGLGRLLDSDKPLSPRNCSSAVIIHGCIGGGFAGFGYEYLAWKGRPLAMLGCSALYGGGVISAGWIRGIVEGAIGGRNNRGPDASD